MLFGKKRRPMVAPSAEWLTEVRLADLVRTSDPLGKHIHVRTKDSLLEQLFRPATWDKPELGTRYICLILLDLVQRVEALEAKLWDLEAKALKAKLGASESS